MLLYYKAFIGISYEVPGFDVRRTAAVVFIAVVFYCMKMEIISNYELA